METMSTDMNRLAMLTFRANLAFPRRSSSSVTIPVHPWFNCLFQVELFDDWWAHESPELPLPGTIRRIRDLHEHAGHLLSRKK
jgi:hypothetical protein